MDRRNATTKYSRTTTHLHNSRHSTQLANCPPKPADDPEIDPRGPVDTASLWNYASYEAILYGMDFMGPEHAASTGAQRPHSRVPKFIVEAITAASKQLPPHHVWLHHQVGMTAWPQGEMPAAWQEQN